MSDEITPKEPSKFTAEEILNESVGPLRSLISRMYANQSGMFNGQRDVYKEAGYPDIITDEQYNLQYKRNGIARRVVNAFPEACWKQDPIIICKDAKFLKEYEGIVRDQKLYHYLFRADKLLGIGRYGIVYLGYNDSSALHTPVKKGAALKFLKPIREFNAKVKTLNEDLKSPNFGKPKSYDIKISDKVTKTVHASRVLHLAEDLEESDIYGTPRMEPCYNFLLATEMVCAAAGEMYWRNALPGLALNADPEADMTQTKTELNQQITDYIQGLTRVLKLQGIDTKQLAPIVAEPRGVIDVLISMISGTTKIPQRILTGSERGELASSQDGENWNERVRERQNNVITQNFIYNLIEKLTENGTISKPKSDVDVEYMDVYNQSDKEKAEIASQLTAAIVKYSESTAQHTTFPIKRFLTDVLHYEGDEADLIIGEIRDDLDNEDFEYYTKFQDLTETEQDTLKSSVDPDTKIEK